MPVSDVSNGEIKEKALKTMQLQKEIVGSFLILNGHCLCQSDLAHFDHLIWPTVSACILVLQFLIPVVFVSFLFGFVCLSGVALSRILISGTAVGFRLERSPARPGGPSVQGKRKPESNRAAAPRLASAFLFPLLQSPAKPVRVTPCFNDVSPIRHSV